MNVGFAQTNITPPLGVYLCGQLEPMIADGIESQLYSKAMCLDDGQICVVICSNDILAISNEFADKICCQASKLCGIPADNIVVTATHTHSGPNTVDVFGKDAKADYVSPVKKQRGFLQFKKGL